MTHLLKDCPYFYQDVQAWPVRNRIERRYIKKISGVPNKKVKNKIRLNEGRL